MITRRSPALDIESRVHDNGQCAECGAMDIRRNGTSFTAVAGRWLQAEMSWSRSGRGCAPHPIRAAHTVASLVPHVRVPSCQIAWHRAADRRGRKQGSRKVSTNWRQLRDRMSGVRDMLRGVRKSNFTSFLGTGDAKHNT